MPAGVTSIGFTVVGASGGYDNGPYGNGMSNGGYGGVATGTLTVTPGSTLYVVVGGQGLSSSGPRNPPSTIAGGYNGGGASGCSTCTSDGGSGGGATDIRTSPDDITTRLVVAGGGGGADGDAHKSWPGGNGGGLVGASVPGEVTYGVATDAYGGSQTSGGVASSCGATPLNTAGTLGNGGTSPAGGGGGGGYYGGGGGCSSGGAGGSGYCDAMLCTSVAYSVASSFGAGSVTLTYTITPPTALQQPSSQPTGHPTIHNNNPLLQTGQPTAQPSAHPSASHKSVVTTVMTITGNNGVGAFNGDGMPASSGSLFQPEAVAVDISGNLYIADTINNRIRLIMKNTGILSTYAGSTGTPFAGGFSGDGKAATNAQLAWPYDVALDSTGTLLYIADYSNNRVRLVTKGATANIISTFAGGYVGYSYNGGDGNQATSAQLNQPSGLAVDASGVVYIADTGNNRIRIVSRSGIISTIAGNGQSAYGSDDGFPATMMSLNRPTGVAIDATGTFLYIADAGNHLIRLVTIGMSSRYQGLSNIMTTYAGNFYFAYNGGYEGDGAAATSAYLNTPRKVAVDSSNNLYIVDTYNQRIRRVTKSTGLITTFVGTGVIGSDDGAATSASMYNPSGVAIDTLGNLYIADTINNKIRVVTTEVLCSAGYYASGNLCLLCVAGTYTASASNAAMCTPCPAGSSSVPGSTTCNYPSRQPTQRPTSIPSSMLPVAVPSNKPSCLPAFSMLPTSQPTLQPSAHPSASHKSVVTTVMTITGNNGVGAFNGDGMPASSGSLFQPEAVAVDISGNLYIADTINNRIRLIMKNTGILSTYAGSTGTPFAGGFSGDGKAATNAQLAWPYDVALDSTGTLLYIADYSNNRVRLVTKGATANIISTFAGGYVGYSYNGGDGNQATSAQLNQPSGLAVDASGVVYIADTGNNRIRIVSRSGIISTIAGNGQSAYGSDDGFPATMMSLNRPTGVAIDATGTFLYIADAGNHLIRLVTIGMSSRYQGLSNIMTTYAGNFYFAYNGGYEGDGAAATSAYLNTPRKVAVDSSNNLYIVDTYNQRIRRVTKSTGLITTFVGTGVIGSDDGAATSASMYNPSGVAIDTLGNLYIADTINNKIRVVTTEVLCSAGYYASGNLCLLCVAGTYTASASNAAMCTPCPAGSSSVPGSTTCNYPSRQPTQRPTSIPSSKPTSQPTSQPTSRPTSRPSSRPTAQPTRHPTSSPTSRPTSKPSTQPTSQPTSRPTSRPSSKPTSQPTSQPTSLPSSIPTGQPTAQPNVAPTSRPTSQPTSEPSLEVGHTHHPSSRPTSEPSQPSSQPSVQPTGVPTSFPSYQPTSHPSSQPSEQPSKQPSRRPSRTPSSQPSEQPTIRPTQQPTRHPTSHPSTQPSRRPSEQPSMRPSRLPSSQPSAQPITHPSAQPSRQPSQQPTQQPTRSPSSQPSRQPSMQPSSQPSRVPTMQPSSQPSKQPTRRPSSRPSRFVIISSSKASYY